MMKNNIFLEDVKVPEIVQKKADRAFLAIQTERSNGMKNKTGKKFKRTLAAAAACMVLVVAAGALAGPLKGILGNFGAGHTENSGKGPEDALLAAVDQIDKIFTLQVKAAGAEEAQLVPLTEGNPIPVISGDDKSKSWVICSGEDEGMVNYCIGLPQITCEGDQIESITYRINNGAFQIIQPEDGDSIIVDGQLYDGEMNTGSIGGDYEEKDGLPSRPFETVLYQSFTLDYGRQSDEYTWINICNERPDSEEIIQLLWGEDGSKEAESSGIQKMLDGTIITCTVQYADNTSQSEDIKVGSCVMSCKEAGEPQDEGIDPEEEMTVITFELQ